MLRWLWLKWANNNRLVKRVAWYKLPVVKHAQTESLQMGVGGGGGGTTQSN
jgi:hypothetical protein